MSDVADARADRRLGYALLFVTSIGWGLNWPFVKVLLREWPPLFARGTAALVAGLALAALAGARGKRLGVAPGEYGRLALASLINVTIWMGAPTVALKWLTVAEGALLVYTMPIWTMLIAWPARGDRPTTRGLASLALGLAGLAVLFSGESLAMGSGKLPGVALALGAAVIFAAGTVTMRPPRGLEPLALSAWQVGLGSLPILLGAALFEPLLPAGLSPAGWTAWLYMTAVPMGICYLSWFGALARVPPSTAATATLLVPVIGISSAALALGEPFGVRQISALVLVLAGVTLALRRA